MEVVVSKIFWQFLYGFVPFYLTAVLAGCYPWFKWALFLVLAALCGLFIYSYTPAGLWRVFLEFFRSTSAEFGMSGLAGILLALVVGPATVRLICRSARTNA